MNSRIYNYCISAEPDKPNITMIQSLARQILSIQGKLQSLGKENSGKFTEENCPLNPSGEEYDMQHNNMSQMISGIGYTQWVCPFCKTTMTP